MPQTSSQVVARARSAKRQGRELRLLSQAAGPPIQEAAGAVPTHGATALLGVCGASGEPAAPADLATKFDGGLARVATHRDIEQVFRSIFRWGLGWLV
jgi:hypothetical protein